MLAILNVTFPFFALVACGYLAVRRDVVPAAAVAGISRYVLYFGLSAMLFRFGAATPTFGVGMELNIIAAAVIGGASLKGGSGTILGAILGMALLSVVSSSLILLDISVYWQDAIRGLILLGAVAIDHVLHNRKQARGAKPAK